MPRFLLGFLCGVLAVVVAASLGLLALSSSTSSPAPITPTPTASASATPPAHGSLLSQVTFTAAQVVAADSDLREVTATGDAVVVGEGGMTAGTLHIEATVPFATAAAQVGEGVELSAAADGRAALHRTITLLGRDIAVRATGRVSAADGLLVIEPETIDLDGPDWVDTVAGAAIDALVTIRQEVTGVPDGMTLRSVTVSDGGFRVTLDGANVSLGP